MASLCIYCRCFPRLCPKCPVSLSWHLYRRWPVRAADRGLCLGRRGNDQAKGRPRTSRLHYLQYVRRVDAFTRQVLHELRCQLVVKHMQGLPPVCPLKRFLNLKEPSVGQILVLI